MALWASVIAVWLAVIGLGIGMSLLYPALFSAALEGVPERERSQAVSTFSLFFDLAQGVGAPVLGLVVALSSERGAFAAAGLIAATGYVAPRRLSQSLTPAPTPARTGPNQIGKDSDRERVC